jgi:hypothetical protein
VWVSLYCGLPLTREPRFALQNVYTMHALALPTLCCLRRGLRNVRLQSCRPPFTFLFDSIPYPPQPAAIALITPWYPSALPSSLAVSPVTTDLANLIPTQRPPEQPDRLPQKPHALLDTHSYSTAVPHCSPRWVRATASPWCLPIKVRYLEGMEGVMAGHWSDRPMLHQDGGMIQG